VTNESFERFRRQMELMDFETLPLFSKPYFSWNLQTDYVGRRLVYRPDTESTMDDARRLLDRFRLTSGALVMAESQTAGRGRNGRSWVSPPDVNLLFTLVLMTPVRHSQRPLFYLAALAISRAIEELTARHGVPTETELKWPNDVLIHGRKVAGVLIETTETADGSPVALVGVGINVNMDASLYPEIADIATSVSAEVGRRLPREELLAAFCNHFESLYEEASSGSSRPFQAWRSRLSTLGREVVATGQATPIRGTAVDVETDGALVIEMASGQRTRVDYGDVTLNAE
jgi:BirA family biotin operon repressor/biotin-[acetyl-CoA-carboxylase] ligase